MSAATIALAEQARRKDRHARDLVAAIEGAEATAAWGTITGKPATFPTSLPDITQSGAALNNVVTWNGTAWVAAAPSGGGGGSPNLDGGYAASNYGGTTAIDGGDATP